MRGINPHGQKRDKKARKKFLVDVTVEFARQPGEWTKLTRDRVASNANYSPALIMLAFGSMENLKLEVMRSAIRNGHFDLIGQGVASGYPMCLKLPPATQRAALESLGR